MLPESMEGFPKGMTPERRSAGVLRLPAVTFPVCHAKFEFAAKTHSAPAPCSAAPPRTRLLA